MKLLTLAAAALLLVVFGFPSLVVAGPGCCGGCGGGAKVTGISAEKLEALLASDKKPVVVDVLSPESYHRAHIAGAINIPLRHLKSLHGKLPKDATIVTYCSGPSCTASVKAAEQLRALGFKDVHEYRGGISEWRKSNRPVVKGEPIRFVSRERLEKERKDRHDLVVIDVLPAAHYDKMHIAGAVNIPLADLKEKAKTLDKNAPVVTYCANYVCGASSKAAVLLTKMGFKDVRDYKGGLHEWKESKLPLAGSKTEAGAEASTGTSGKPGASSASPPKAPAGCGGCAKP